MATTLTKPKVARKVTAPDTLYVNTMLLYCVLEHDPQKPSLWRRVKTFLGNHMLKRDAAIHTNRVAERLKVGTLLSVPLERSDTGIYFTFTQSDPDKKKKGKASSYQQHHALFVGQSVFQLELQPYGEGIPERKLTDAMILAYDVTGIDDKCPLNQHVVLTDEGYDYEFFMDHPLHHCARFGFYYPGSDTNDRNRMGYDLAIADIQRHGQLIEVDEDVNDQIPMEKS